MARRIEECGPALRALPGGDRDLLERYLRNQLLLRGRVTSLHASCVSARLCQADLVLACLRLNLIECAEALVGHPIVRCPPSPLLRPARLTRAARRGDDRVVVGTRAPEPVERGKRRLLATGLYERISRARVGMSVRTLLARGVTRRDVRIAVRRGYLRMEEAR